MSFYISQRTLRKNKQKYLDKARRWNDNKRREYLLFLKEFFSINHCIDCQESDWIVLEFDHRNGNDKIGSVSELIRQGRSFCSIKKEIDKCDVRCSNCHKRKTAKEQNWHKLIM